MNADDPSGLDTKLGLTLGLCGNAYAAIGEIVGLGGQGQFCGLSSSSGNPGVSVTLGAAALNVGATIVGTFDYVVSDAGNVNQMAGPFYAVQTNLDIAGGALSGTVFWGASQPNDNTSMFGPLTGIFGYENGLGIGLPPIGGDAGIWLQDTKVHEFGGWTCWLSGLCLLGKQIAKAVALFAPSRSKADAILQAAWQVVQKYTDPSLASCPNERPTIEA